MVDEQIAGTSRASTHYSLGSIHRVQEKNAKVDEYMGHKVWYTSFANYEEYATERALVTQHMPMLR